MKVAFSTKDRKKLEFFSHKTLRFEGKGRVTVI